MTDFERVLQLFVDGAFGKSAKIDDFDRIEDILKIAYEQNIYYSILSAILRSEKAEVLEEAEPSARSELKNVQLKNYVRMFTLSEILLKFEAAGIPYALLKGHTVGILYNDPYSRVSSDVDLLINPKDEKKAHRLLCKNGFLERSVRGEEEKHGIYHHPIVGMLELHVSLFNKKTSEIWFASANGVFDVEPGELSFERLEKIQIEDMYFYTLEINKRVEYLFLHNVKHFILGGSSIRAIVDFFFTYTKCQGIDFAAFHEKIKKMNLDVFFNAMITTVLRFSELDGKDIPFFKECDGELVDFLLYDMEKGSWLGYGKDGKTLESWRAFEEQKQEDSKKKRKSNVCKVLGVVFPSARRLKKNYAYCRKYPVLLPVAWLHRALRMAFGKVKIAPKGQLNEREKERIELLKKMKIMRDAENQ